MGFLEHGVDANQVTFVDNLLLVLFGREFLLNLTGERNLEPGKDIPKHGQSELWQRKQSIRPPSVPSEIRERDEKSPRVWIRELWSSGSEKIRYVFYGYIDNGKPRITMIHFVGKKSLESYLFAERIPANEAGCKPDVLDVNFDGYPDLLLHHDCRDGRHRYVFYLTGISVNERVSLRLNPFFTQKLQGELSLEPAKRLIHVSHLDADGKTVRKSYQVSSDPNIDPFSEKYLAEYQPEPGQKP